MLIFASGRRDTSHNLLRNVCRKPVIAEHLVYRVLNKGAVLQKLARIIYIVVAKQFDNYRYF